MKKTILFYLFGITLLFAQNNLEKAKQLAEEKKFEEAKSILENIIDENEKNAEAYFILGRVFMAQKEFEDASDTFEEAVDLDENNSEYHLWLGRAYGADAMQSSFITKAVLAPKIKTQFKLAVELDSNNVQARVALAQFYLQAPGIVGGDVDKAIEHGKILVLVDEPNGRILLAQAYQAKGNDSLAMAEFKILLDKYGNDKKFAGIYNAYGYILLKNGKYNQAIEAFKKQVELAPERANSYDSLGDGYRKIGKLELAAEQYKKATKIDPEFEPSKNKLEDILEELDNN